MAKTKISLAQARSMQPIDVINAVNVGIEIVDTALPVIKTLFEKVNEWIAAFSPKNIDSWKNVRLRLAALEAKDLLQKELNKAFEARLQALEAAAPAAPVANANAQAPATKNRGKKG